MRLNLGIEFVISLLCDAAKHINTHLKLMEKVVRFEQRLSKAFKSSKHVRRHQSFIIFFQIFFLPQHRFRKIDTPKYAPVAKIATAKKK